MTDAERTNAMALLTGSFWAESYGDKETVGVVARTTAYLVDELSIKLADAAACAVVDTVPAFHRPRWYPLQYVEDGPGVREFGDGQEFGLGANAYGQLDARPAYSAPLALSDCPTLYEFEGGLGRVWLYGRDYTLNSDGWAVFYEDPGVVTLWAFEPAVDLAYVYRSFGFLTGVKEDSSESYAAYVRAYLAQAAGDTAAGLRTLVCRAFNAPCAERSETVEQVTDHGDGRLTVVTDRACYPTDEADVSAGDVLRAGDSVDGAVTFATYRGPVDAPPDVIPLDAGMVLTGAMVFGPGLDRTGPNEAEFDTDTAARESRYGLTTTAAMGGVLTSEAAIVLREILRYGVTLVTVRSPTSTGTARMAATRPVLPIHAALVFDLRATTLEDSGGLGADEEIGIGYGMTKLVDGGALVGYDHSILTPLSC